MARKRTAIALAVLALVAVATVVAALRNPWRFTAFFALAHRPTAIGVAVAAGLLLAGAIVLAVNGTAKRVLIGLGALVLCVVPALTVPAIDRARGQMDTMDVSPDGRFEVVKFTVDGSSTELYVRSRAGLLSREASTPIARCDRDPFVAGAPREAVRFTGPLTIAVPVDGEDTAVVTFDADSLAPDRTVVLCPAA